MRAPSLRVRVFAAILLPALVLVGLGGWGWVESRALLERDLGTNLSRLAAEVAARVDTDVLVILKPGAEGTRTHRNLQRQLSEAKRASNARRIWVVDAHGRVWADTAALPIGAPLAELAEDRLEIRRVLRGERAYSWVPFRGADGRLYERGYAPLRQDGKVIGIVGVEASGAFFAALQRWLELSGALALIALVLLTGLAWLLTRALTRPVERLMRSADRIGTGDLATPVRRERTKEMDVLARALEQMRSALEARNRQLEMMLAGVAHEVRNPLGGIELFAGLLDEELHAPELSEARDHLSRIRRETAYLRQLVEDFLSFAREAPPSLEEISAESLIEDVRTRLRADAEARPVSLNVQAEPGRVRVDPNLFIASVVNLGKNAIQASPPGGEVGLVGRIEGAQYLIEVTDQGPGIEAGLRERVFEPFFTTRERGSGLGLPLAKKIVEAMGGALTLESAPGRTRFRISIPAEPATAHAWLKRGSGSTSE